MTLIVFLIIAIILTPKLINLYADCDGYYERRYFSYIIAGVSFFIAFGIGYLLHFSIPVCFGLSIALIILIFFIAAKNTR